MDDIDQASSSAAITPIPRWCSSWDWEQTVECGKPARYSATLTCTSCHEYTEDVPLCTECTAYLRANGMASTCCSVDAEIGLVKTLRG